MFFFRIVDLLLNKLVRAKWLNIGLVLFLPTCPIIVEHVVIIFVAQKVTIATVCPAINTLITALGACNSKTAGEFYFLFKVALNPTYINNIQTAVTRIKKTTTTLL